MLFPTVTWLLLVAGLLGVWAQDYYEEKTVNKRPRGRGAQLQAAAIATNVQKHNGQGMRGKKHYRFYSIVAHCKQLPFQTVRSQMSYYVAFL